MLSLSLPAATPQRFRTTPPPIARRQEFPKDAHIPSAQTDFTPSRLPRWEDALDEASGFTRGVYYPHLLRTMGAALDAACETINLASKDAAVARLLMASAIIEAVDAGIRQHEFLVDKAVRARRPR